MSNASITQVIRPSTRRWSKPAPSRVYSDNDLINAYMKGRADGMDRQEKVLIEKLKANLEKAKNNAAQLYGELNKTFSCLYLKLRVKDITEFDCLFIVDEADFVKDEFKGAYKTARDMKKKVNEPTFNLSFSFMPFTSGLSEDELLIDGYYFEYGKQGKS